MTSSRVRPLRTVAAGAVVCGLCLTVPMSAAHAVPATLTAPQGLASASFVGANYTTTVQDPNGTNTPFALKATAALTVAGLDLATAQQAKAAADSLDATIGTGAPLLGPSVVSTAPPGGTDTQGPRGYAVPQGNSGAAAASVTGITQTATTRPVANAATEKGTSPVASAGTTGGTFDVAPAGTIDPTSPIPTAVRQAAARVTGGASPQAVSQGTGQLSATGGSTTTNVTLGAGGASVTSTASATSGAVTVVGGLLAIKVTGAATLSATAKADPTAATATYTPPALSYDLGNTGTFTPVPAGGFTLSAAQQAAFGLTLTIKPGTIAKSVDGQVVSAAAVAATVTLGVGPDPAAPLFSVTAQVGQLAVAAGVPAAVTTPPTTTAPPVTPTPPGLANTGTHDTLPLTGLGFALTATGIGLAWVSRRRVRHQH